MPYKAGDRLPGERASHLGHLEVLKSDLVRNLVRSFESPADYEMGDASLWTPIPMDGQPLPIDHSNLPSANRSCSKCSIKTTTDFIRVSDGIDISEKNNRKGRNNCLNN